MSIVDLLDSKGLFSEDFFATIHVPVQGQPHRVATIFSSHPRPEPLGIEKTLGHGTVREAFVDGMMCYVWGGAMADPAYRSTHYPDVQEELAVPLGVHPVAVGAGVPTAKMIVKFASTEKEKFRGLFNQFSELAAGIGGQLLFPKEFEHSSTFLFPGEVMAPYEESRVVARVSGISDWILEGLSKHPESIHQMPPRKFEELVAKLLERDGYEVLLSPQTRDGGYDVLAEVDLEIGRVLALVECKKYDPNRPVGVEVVRNLFGAMHHRDASCGLVVTTSRFTRDAYDFQDAHRYRIDLKDFSSLKKWLDKAGLP